LQLKTSRQQLEPRLANVPRCLIGMEACSCAHHIGRQLEALGHDVRLIPAQYVKPFLKGHKNDYRDAEAIAEADHALCNDQDAGADGFAGSASRACASRQAAHRREQTSSPLRPGLGFRYTQPTQVVAGPT
jgi:hypothetical protein